MRRFVPLLVAALMGAMAAAQAPEITAPGRLVLPDLTKSGPVAGYELGAEVVKSYQARGVTRFTFTDYAGQADVLPRYDAERDLNIEGFSIEVGKAGRDLFQTSHRDDPFTVFTAEIKSEDAISMRLCLDLGHLRNGEEVWIASPDSGMTLGPYYSTDDVPDGLWLPRIFGDTTLLIVRSLVDEVPNMAVKHVGHMFVPLQESLPPGLACLTNINCESDPGVQQLKSSVGLLSFALPVRDTFFGAIFQFSSCTGTLLNNPATEAEEPLFLTANHCIATQRVARTAEVIWDWESLDCFGFNIPVESTTVRVPIYLDRGSNYDPDRGFPAQLEFDVNFFTSVFSSTDPPQFEPNPRLLEWYSKIPEVTLSETVPGRVTFTFGAGGHQGPVLDLVYNSNGTRIVSGSADNTAKLWDVSNGAVLQSFNGHEDDVRGVAISPDSALVVTGSSDGTAKLWDTATGEEIRTFLDHEDAINGVDFSPDGTQVLTGSSDGTAKLWSVETGEVIRTFVGDDGVDGISHDGPVRAVAFSPSGAQVVTGSDDSTAILWTTATGDPIRAFDGEDQGSGHTEAVLAVAFSPSGQRLLTGSADSTARAWTVATGAQQLIFTGHDGEVRGVTFSPDGSVVMTGATDNLAKLWSANNALLIANLPGHDDDVNAVAIAPLTIQAASASSDGTIRLWDVNTFGNTFTLTAAEITTFDNQVPEIIPELGQPQENPFLLGELILTDVGSIASISPFIFTNVAGFNRNGGFVQINSCNSAFSPSGEPGGCLRADDALTLYIPRLSRARLPRSRVECVLATNAVVDGTLLRLAASMGLYADQPVVPAHNGRFYAGWTTRAPFVGEQILSISHPGGFDMKYAEAVITETGATRRIGQFHFKDQIGTEFTRGTVLGGSSGSAAFLADGTNSVVGMLSNGSGDCIIPGDEYYGSFAAFFPDIEPFIYRPDPPVCDAGIPTTTPLRNYRAMPVRDTSRVVHTWLLPSDPIQDLRLVRRTDRFPRHPSDGTVINLSLDAVSHIEGSLTPGIEYFYGLFTSFDGSTAGHRQFARVVVGDATGATTYEPLSEDFSRLLNPMDLAFSQLTFVPLVDLQEMLLSDEPQSFMNLSNYRLLYKPGVTRFPVEKGPGTIPLPFRELESISGPGGALIIRPEFGGIFVDGNPVSGAGFLTTRHLLKLPNAVPFFGRFHRDLVVSSQGFLTFNLPADTVTLTQGHFSPLLSPSYASHYQIPRISFLFSELSPQAGGSVWIRVMDDRIALTFEEVPVWMSFPPLRNSVQTELFFNGQIRMTFLNINARDAIVGISDGQGVPIDPAQAEFVFPGRLQSDLTSFDAPLPMQLIPIPVLTAVETETLSFTPTVELPPGSPAPVFTAVDEPVGLTVNPNTGRIQWPTGLTDAGLYDFDLIVTSGNLAASQRVVVVIEDAIQFPFITEVSVTPSFATEDDVLTFEYDYNHIENIPEGQSTIYWFRDGQMVYALVNSRFVPEFVTKPGERWYAEVIPETITGRQGQMVRSNVVLIAPAAGFQPGDDDKLSADVNLDGRVDAIDVQLVINDALSGKKTNPYTDINRDGKVNAIDVQLVINAALE